MVPILQGNIWIMKCTGTLMFLALLIYLSLEVIGLVQNAILCKQFEKLYEIIRAEEKERYKSYFITNSEQRRRRMKDAFFIRFFSP